MRHFHEFGHKSLKGVAEYWGYGVLGVASLHHSTTPILHSSHQSQLQLRRFGHHALVPRRVPDPLPPRLLAFFDPQQFVLPVPRPPPAHPPARRRPRPLPVRPSTPAPPPWGG